MKLIRNVGCLVVILVMALVGFAISQPEQVRAFIRSGISLSLGQAKLDLPSLTEKELRGKLTIHVYNRFPVGVTLMNLSYSIFLNNQEIGSGIQASPQAPITGLATSSLEITFAVNGAKARQALTSAAPAQALQMLGHLVDQIKKKKREPSPAGAGLLRVVGKAEFQVLAGSVQIPLDRAAEFERSF